MGAYIDFTDPSSHSVKIFDWLFGLHDNRLVFFCGQFVALITGNLPRE